ncbi:flagellar FlbD family protein [Clostridium sp. MSJ-11]|uniref:Flagellar FlbD family protein n=1 Tax=Clostridium mobile TaxID=2841512 RepID=A0ABS6ECV8_9CLOT|nr:flagellar FlbD family protein [Clostridium mobile]MBU5483029.1 flagellar FlbD family protein [Clostridium mobile]
MIEVTGLDNKKIILNADHIEKMESVPESLITLTNGRKYLVKESIEIIVEKVTLYKRNIFTVNIQEASRR